ncbi:hypothetical protein MK904_05765 [Loigolactobacillus coryniformis]|jgi:DNA-binding cell septation regulator SpoVG|nr:MULTISPECIES: hypothetical protein [Lactobacillaceae]MCI2020518.1 hypothetical protein [Lentilactobacillus buchneri]OEH89930.1 hypothetical protein ATO00_08040 [Loigolactobacillus coryniformis subsp. coryniformis]SFZ87097.1 hypothetical protein LREN565_0210 [Loigolactobacillus rennini]MBW4801859.1 hypothetical protein [Loigolactobacillus coryniformis subsp. torquens]MBW4804560.1 hypothetical protein [Loigolactobacillus coryniformis subsp. torquens]
MIFISSINMYLSKEPSVLMTGTIVINHAMIINNVKLIRGNQRLFLKFPETTQGRVVYPLSAELYQYLLQQTIEYYNHYKSELKNNSDF